MPRGTKGSMVRRGCQVAPREVGWGGHLQAIMTSSGGEEAWAESSEAAARDEAEADVDDEAEADADDAVDAVAAGGLARGLAR